MPPAQTKNTSENASDNGSGYDVIERDRPNRSSSLHSDIVVVEGQDEVIVQTSGITAQ